MTRVKCQPVTSLKKMDGTINKPIKQRQADAKPWCPWQESSCGSDKEVKSIRQLIIASADKWYHHQYTRTEAPGRIHVFQSGNSEKVADAVLCLILEKAQLVVQPQQPCAQRLEHPLHCPWTTPSDSAAQEVYISCGVGERLFSVINILSLVLAYYKAWFLVCFFFNDYFSREFYLTYPSGLNHDYSMYLPVHKYWIILHHQAMEIYLTHGCVNMSLYAWKDQTSISTVLEFLW